MADDLAEARTKVLDTIRESDEPLRPDELVQKLDAMNTAEGLTRVAMWSLIDQRLVTLTSDRRLRVGER